MFEVYYDRVYKYAYTILLNRENAEDVVEETFLAAYVAYPSYEPVRSSLATWLTQEEREFLDLRYVMGLTDKEVGALYSLESKAVNKRYQRLLKRCRQLLDGGEKLEKSVNPLSPIGVLPCI